MNLLIWLDLPLIAFALLIMSPRLCYALFRRRIDGRAALSRRVQTATVLLFYLGLGVLGTACVDAGLAEWAKGLRFGGADDDIREAMMAPDFTLPALDEDRIVRLSDFRGNKPVVLIFGNFY
jgi:hypothetical protein